MPHVRPKTMKRPAPPEAPIPEWRAFDALPDELRHQVLSMAVTRGVFHTYAALLCVSHTVYAICSQLIGEHFTTERLLEKRELAFHYKGLSLGLACARVARVVDDAVLRHLTQLTKLDLRTTAIGDDGLVGLTRLTSLDLSHTNTISNAALRALPHLTNLKLYANTRIASITLIALTGITALELSNTTQVRNCDLCLMTWLRRLALPGDGGITPSTLGRMTGLERLSLAGNKTIMGYGLSPLAASLTSLDLSNNYRIEDDVLRQMTSLTRLKLCFNVTISDASVSALTRLTELRLSHSYMVTDRAVCCLTRLRVLDLSGCPTVTAAAVVQLPRLTNLFLIGNVGTDITLWHLTHLDQMRLVYSDHDDLAQQVAEFMRARSDATAEQFDYVQHYAHSSVLEWRRHCLV